MKNIVVCFSILAVVSGCASKAKNIAPSYVSTAVYDSMSCSAMKEEGVRLSQAAAAAIGKQDSAATADAVKTGVGIVFFLPALFFNEGDGIKATEVARLKGEMDALQRASVRKKCNISFQKR
ncbi:hypothetical protein ACFQ3K_13615 [Brucella gallinifaecis]|uniref:Lipoprotein n=1 Tax=Brucella gallinifaecis TaxID=215590 RepID=A0A502BTN5_9HYPH|nr:hypothetical protein [Brucella gallinifaecis]TPF76518.1 hypothetical protein FHY56_03190 [Brucella gallinifaecis]